MADIFNYRRNPKPRGVFSTEESSLTFGQGSNPVGYLIQNWNANYQQQVSELFELGSSAVYWSKGRPVGNGAIGRIVGDRGAGTGLFPDAAFDLCDGGAMMRINAKSGSCKGKSTSVGITMDGCVVTSIGYTMQAQNALLSENIGWRFALLNVA